MSNSLRTCPKCGKTIQSDSDFCTYCGTPIEKELPKKKISMIVVILSTLCLILAIFLVAGIYFYYVPLCQKYDALQRTAEQQSTNISRLQAKNSELTKDKSDLSSELNDSRYKANRYDKLITGLSSASKSNGIMSFSSPLVCIRKGTTETLKVQWIKYNVSMWCNTDNHCIDATWDNHSDITITGVTPGVAQLQFASNEAMSNDCFSIVVVCY